MKKSTYKIENLDVYISNEYNVFCKFLKSSSDNSSLDELNFISETVIQEGELLVSFTIGSRIDLDYILLGNNVYKYIVTTTLDSIHYLLIDYFEKPNSYTAPTEISICCDLYDIPRKNSYEAFLNYAKINHLPINKATNNPLYSDFEASLFDPHPKMYHRDPIYNFYFTENVNKPGQYFHFVISNNTIFISEYTVPEEPYPYMFFAGSDIDLLNSDDVRRIYGD